MKRSMENVTVQFVLVKCFVASVCDALRSSVKVDYFKNATNHVMYVAEATFQHDTSLIVIVLGGEQDIH